MIMTLCWGGHEKCTRLFFNVRYSSLLNSIDKIEYRHTVMYKSNKEVCHNSQSSIHLLTKWVLLSRTIAYFVIKLWYAKVEHIILTRLVRSALRWTSNYTHDSCTHWALLLLILSYGNCRVCYTCFALYKWTYMNTCDGLRFVVWAYTNDMQFWYWCIIGFLGSVFISYIIHNEANGKCHKFPLIMNF